MPHLINIGTTCAAFSSTTIPAGVTLNSGVAWIGVLAANHGAVSNKTGKIAVSDGSYDTYILASIKNEKLQSYFNGLVSYYQTITGVTPSTGGGNPSPCTTLFSTSSLLSSTALPGAINLTLNNESTVAPNQNILNDIRPRINDILVNTLNNNGYYPTSYTIMPLRISNTPAKFASALPARSTSQATDVAAIQKQIVFNWFNPPILRADDLNTMLYNDPNDLTANPPRTTSSRLAVSSWQAVQGPNASTADAYGSFGPSFVKINNTEAANTAPNALIGYTQNVLFSDVSYAGGQTSPVGITPYQGSNVHLYNYVHIASNPGGAASVVINGAINYADDLTFVCLGPSPSLPIAKTQNVYDTDGTTAIPKDTYFYTPCIDCSIGTSAGGAIAGNGYGAVSLAYVGVCGVTNEKAANLDHHYSASGGFQPYTTIKLNTLNNTVSGGPNISIGYSCPTAAQLNSSKGTYYLIDPASNGAGWLFCTTTAKNPVPILTATGGTVPNLASASGVTTNGIKFGIMTDANGLPLLTFASNVMIGSVANWPGLSTYFPNDGNPTLNGGTQALAFAVGVYIGTATTLSLVPNLFAVPTGWDSCNFFIMGNATTSGQGVNLAGSTTAGAAGFTLNSYTTNPLYAAYNTYWGATALANDTSPAGTAPNGVTRNYPGSTTTEVGQYILLYPSNTQTTEIPYQSLVVFEGTSVSSAPAEYAVGTKTTSVNAITMAFGSWGTPSTGSTISGNSLFYSSGTSSTYLWFWVSNAYHKNYPSVRKIYNIQINFKSGTAFLAGELLLPSQTPKDWIASKYQTLSVNNAINFINGCLWEMYQDYNSSMYTANPNIFSLQSVGQVTNAGGSNQWYSLAWSLSNANGVYQPKSDPATGGNSPPNNFQLVMSNSGGNGATTVTPAPFSTSANIPFINSAPGSTRTNTPYGITDASNNPVNDASGNQATTPAFGSFGPDPLAILQNTFLCSYLTDITPPMQ